MDTPTPARRARATSRTLPAARIVLLTALACSVLHASPALAQQVDTACTYLACAMRVEQKGFGTWIVRGAQGERVARLGSFSTRPSLATLVSRSDSATAYAREHAQLAPRGTVIGLAGSLLAVVPLVHNQGRTSTRDAAISLTGAAISLYGAFTVAQAQRALARSIWWYNESLSR